MLLRASCLSLSLSLFPLLADPPAAMVRTKLQVPSSLRTGAFAQDRFLMVPPGFQISLVSQVAGARFLAVAPNGDILVSQPGSGKVTLIRRSPGGSAPQQFTFAAGLKSPHGVVFHTIGSTTWVYISESNQIDRYVYLTGDTAAHDKQVVVEGLPDSATLNGYAHPLKNIALDSRHNLYVAIGSSCNVCAEDTASTPLRAAIYVFGPDGSGGRLFARGLRNAEGLAMLPGTDSPDNDRLWVVVNNRDNLPYAVKDASGNYGQVLTTYVDNHPPDLFTSVLDGGNYGWPFCNSNPDSGFDRMPFDLDYDTNRDGRVACAAMTTPDKGIQAHSAPLGLSFLHASAFALPYRNGAVAALHGSWDRSSPTGFKVIWFGMAAAPGPAQDLVAGWFDEAAQSVWGRPVAAVPDNEGLLISDDLTGGIYRLTYSPGALSAASGYALLAPGSLASFYGTALASQTVAAPSAQWPSTLGGFSLTVRDSAGVSRPALLSYVSPTQVNFEVPPDSAPGTAALLYPSGTASAFLAAIAPALFGTADPLPASAGTYLSLYGTGIRNRTSVSNVHATITGPGLSMQLPLQYAGPQGGFPGLDQVNVLLPAALGGAGEVAVFLTVDGQSSNPVKVRIP